MALEFFKCLADKVYIVALHFASDV